MSDSPIEIGQVLLCHEEATDVLPERYRLWTVKSLRKIKHGVSATLLGWSPGCLATATATFPDGLVTGPWQMFALSQGDLAHVWKAGADGR